MPQSSLGDDGNDPHALRLLELIESFMETLHERAPRSHAERVIDGDQLLRGARIRQEPERFVEEQLIRDVAEQVLGYEYRPQTKGVDGLEGRKPDFEVMNSACQVLGEIKRPNRIDQARKESHEYLDMAESRPAAGVSTDGWTWILHVARAPNGDPEYHAHEALRPIMRKLGRVERHETEVYRRGLREDAAGFVGRFHRRSIERTLRGG